MGIGTRPFSSLETTDRVVYLKPFLLYDELAQRSLSVRRYVR